MTKLIKQDMIGRDRRRRGVRKGSIHLHLGSQSGGVEPGCWGEASFFWNRGKVVDLGVL